MINTNKKQVTFNKLVLDNKGGFSILKQPYGKRHIQKHHFNKYFNKYHHPLIKYI
jgi:hypothetical protein